MCKLFFSLALIAALAGASATTAFAQETNAAKHATNGAAVQRVQTLPFRGTVASVDATAKTVTLQGEKKQVLLVTAQTKILKDGKAASFSAIAVGDKVQGSRTANSEGKSEAKLLKIMDLKAPATPTPPGPASTPAAPAAKP